MVPQIHGSENGLLTSTATVVCAERCRAAPKGAVAGSGDLFCMTKNDNLEFHIKEQDYFGTLATVLDLLAQDLDTQSARLKNIRDDLLYLQERYEIVRREPD